MLTITTCQQYPELSANLQGLWHLLRQQVKITITPWQNLPMTDFVLPLCCWDYSEQANQFIYWLKQAQKVGTDFFNPISLLLWNSHKNYLCDLAKMGKNVIPSLIVPPNNTLIKQIMCQQHWHTVVIKPTIGQSGKNVICLTQQALNTINLSHYKQEIVLQPFIPEIQTYGETSLIFFNGQYSHAVKRQPRQGEWRANSAYGVQIIPISPKNKIQQQAQNLINQLPQIPLYARIDGIVLEEKLLINELELIEPALYLNEDSTQTLARVLINHIKK
ncbi:ATP-grasp domain-containing protein [Volucribacter amazonae]|uniref:ATP-grasp domain-containing protein n=1 Tax=Volucribacter amazonae TaxID=256731 RepID=A0A9X4SPW6_9PAST|nr:glutathione synthetase [Volucribacter amazonae]MDG6894581.1 hypothetical protein [Volucribacter amazonae]